MSNCMEQVVSYNSSVSAIDSLLLNLDKKKELAKILIASGLIPKNLDTPEKVLVCLFKAQEIGIPPMEALASMPVINGKVTMQGNLILSLINKSHNVSQLKIDSKDNQCTVTMSRKDYDMSHTASFNIDDAKKAGLMDKQIWRQYTKLMLQWRAVAICARVVFPDIMSGLYTPEEIACIDNNIHADIDQLTGDVIVAPVNGKQIDLNVSGQKSASEKPAEKQLEMPAEKPAEKKAEKPAEKSDPVLNMPFRANDKASEKTNPAPAPNSDPAPNNMDEIEALFSDGHTWNGKIYRGNTVYIANKKFTLSSSEIDDLKDLYDKIVMREKEPANDDLPF